MSFLDMAQDLVADAEAKAAFDADPDAFLAARGFDGLSAADVADAVGFVADTLPADAARRLTDPEADGDGLDRLARLDPADLQPNDLPPDGLESDGLGAAEPAFLEHDPSGELDLPDDLDQDPVAAHHTGSPEAGTEDGGPWRPDESEQDPGFGVGYTPEDADDVSPPAPELAHLTDHPLDLTLDATHVADLALDAADPISEAFAYAEQGETAAHHAEAVEHDAGHDLHHDDADHHHHDGDHDGHLDL